MGQEVTWYQEMNRFKEGEIRAENNSIIKKILASRCYLFI